MKILVTGSSGFLGSELNLEVPETIKQNYTFAKLVSDYFGAECINLGQPGISNDLLPLILFENINNIDTQNDTIFFCLTSNSRVSMFSDKKYPLTVLPSIQDNSRRDNEHPYWKEWYKYFDNECNQIFNYERNINLLSQWCENRQLNFYFMNLFTVVTESIFDASRPANWLLPKDQSLSNFIFPITDIEFGGIVLEDRGWLTELQWSQQQQAIAQYVKPCFCHPNVAGHKKIANELINLLKKSHYK